MHRKLLVSVLALMLTAWLHDRGRVTRPTDEAVAAWLRATLQMKEPNRGSLRRGRAACERSLAAR